MTETSPREVPPNLGWGFPGARTGLPWRSGGNAAAKPPVELRFGPRVGPRPTHRRADPAETTFSSDCALDVSRCSFHAQLPPTGAVVVVAPLKLVDGTGTPTRVLALV
jgi:hypothetical protein